MEDRDIVNLVVSRGPLQLEDLLSRLPEEERGITQLRAIALVKMGYLDAELSGGKLILKPPRHAPEGLRRAAEQPEVDVVANIPGLGIGQVPSQRCLDMLSAFLAIVKQARHVLRICSPFADQPTLSMLVPHFRGLAGRGVEVRFLTRPERFHLLKPVLSEIWEAYKRASLEEKFQCRVFAQSVGGLLIAGLHAKMVIADSDLAYVGSGELRRHSLMSNFEVGLLVRKDGAGNLAYIFDLIWENSTKAFI
jgi:phosphatidylserine/phosphatidylglycerophosphate/cardiolipin synthase-like enzyme